MRLIKRLAPTIAVVGVFFGLALASCGDGGAESCPGIICTDCSGSGDCNVECQPDEVETCVGLQFFGDPNPDDLRCAFCE